MTSHHREHDLAVAALEASGSVEFQTRMVPERYIQLPWKRIATGVDVALGRDVKVGEVMDSGVIDITEKTLYEIAGRSNDDYLFGNIPTFHVGEKQKWALIQAGLAVAETRGAIHGTEALAALLGER